MSEASWDPAQLPRGRGRVHVVGDGLVRELVLDNPAARNALGPGMMADLAQVLPQLEAGGFAALIVRGQVGGGFCAGGDLRSVREHLLGPGTAAGMARTMAGLLDRLANLPCLVLAAVEGQALGGGAELLTACDEVVAARDARIGFVHASLGVSPGWGGGQRLVRRVGRRSALCLLLPDSPPTAEHALAHGLIDRICPPGLALSRCRARAEQVAGMPLEAVAAAVRIARSGDPGVELDAFVSLWGGPAHRAALAAMSQGRR